MPLRVSCPGCQAPMKVPDEARGRKVRCPKCQVVFSVPAAEPSAAPPPVAAAPPDDPVSDLGEPAVPRPGGDRVTKSPPPRRSADEDAPRKATRRPRDDYDEDGEDDDRPPRRGAARRKSRAGLYIALGVGLFFLLCGGVGLAVWLAVRSAARNVAANFDDLAREMEKAAKEAADQANKELEKAAKEAAEKAAQNAPATPAAVPGALPPDPALPDPAIPGIPPPQPAPGKPRPPAGTVVFTEYTSPEGRFTVLLPGRPTVSRAGSGTTGRVSAVDPAGVRYEVNWQVYTRVPFKDSQSFQDFVAKTLARAATAKKEIQLGDYPGLEYTAPGRSTTGKPAGTAVTRAYGVKDRLYRLTVTAPVGQEPPAEAAARFFDSFRLTDAPTARPGEPAKPGPAPDKPLSAAPTTPAEAMKALQARGVRVFTPTMDGRTLYDVHFHGSATVIDADLKLLALLKPLNMVVLGESNTDAAIKELIALGGAAEIDVIYSKLTDAGLKDLAAVPGLKRLELRGDHSEAALADLARIPALEHLRLESIRATKTGLKHLAGAPKLRHLGLSGTSSDADLAGLAGAPALETLVLFNFNVSPSGDGLKALADLPALKDLSLSGLDVKDSHLRHLAGVKSLRKLNLGAINLTDAAVPELAKLTWLEELTLSGGRFTKDGVEKLRQALPRCKVQGPITP